MHGTANSLAEIDALAGAHPAPDVDVLICPPAPLISRAAERASQTAIAIGGQECHAQVSGAHTGDVSADMLADAGATYVILGHSERRQDHGETNADVCAKTNAALSAGLIAIVCVGESLEERQSGRTLSVLSEQLSGSLPDGLKADTCVIAYEPIWAIGTGLTPSTDEIAQAHAHIRAELIARYGATTGDGLRILYGGSVKPANAAEIFAIANVDGALVGGASLSSEDFSPIVSALEATAAS